MKKLILFLLLLSTTISFGQYSLAWTSCTGGVGEEKIFDMKVTSDGGCIVVGKRGGTGFLVKYDVDGTEQWKKEFYYFPTSVYANIISSVLQTADGGYIFAGLSGPGSTITGNHGSSDALVVKTDSDGNIIWQKSYGGTAYDHASCISPTSDGGYVVACYASSNNGDVSGNHGGSDYWIFKIDANGVLQWQKCYGGSGYDEAFSVEQTTDGGYIVSGEIESNNGDVLVSYGDKDLWFLKLSDIGTIEWQKTIGITSESYIDPTIAQTSDGGYIASANYPAGYLSLGHLIKMTADGTTQWDMIFHGTGINAFGQDIKSVTETADGGFAAIGEGTGPPFLVTVPGNGPAGKDIWVGKANASGVAEWNLTLGSGGDDFGTVIHQSADGNLVGAGYVGQHLCGNPSGNWDGFVFKIQPTPLSIENVEDTTSIKLYPNPATSEISLDISEADRNSGYGVYDSLGRKALSGKFEDTHPKINIDNLTSGLYLLTIDHTRTSVKFIKQ